MQFFIAVFAAIALAAPIFATPAPAIRSVERFSGRKNGKHIIKMKKGMSKSVLFGKLKINSTVTHEWELLNGFAGMTENTISIDLLNV